MSKKIKILLAGYVNNINAQDLNCRALATFLDREKFEITAFLVPQEFKDFEIGEEMKGVNLIQLNRPAKILWYWIYLKGILSCDVAYFPKGQKRYWSKLLCTIFRKKSFTTVEGVMDKETYRGALQRYGSDDGIRFVFNTWDKTFSITKYMSSRNAELLGIRSDGVLYLGVDYEYFKVTDKKNKRNGEPLDFVFIGRDIKRKRIGEFLDLAKQFPRHRFHVIGGNENEDIYQSLGYETITNVKIHGPLPHEKMATLLREMDIHIFPSRSEGFPKVTLETAAAGVPSIVYSDYGASEWITDAKDGYVVNTFDEIVDIINDLQSHPDKLSMLSENAKLMASRFDWRVVVKDWEKMISSLYMS